MFELKRDSKAMEILQEISHIFKTAKTQQDKNFVLSAVAQTFSFAVLQTVIPGLTSYRFKKARQMRLSRRLGKSVPVALKRRIKYETGKVEHFVAFITSDVDHQPTLWNVQNEAKFW